MSIVCRNFGRLGRGGWRKSSSIITTPIVSAPSPGGGIVTMPIVKAPGGGALGPTPGGGITLPIAFAPSGGGIISTGPGKGFAGLRGRGRLGLVSTLVGDVINYGSPPIPQSGPTAPVTGPTAPWSPPWWGWGGWGRGGGVSLPIERNGGGSFFNPDRSWSFRSGSANIAGLRSRSRLGETTSTFRPIGPARPIYPPLAYRPGGSGTTQPIARRGWGTTYGTTGEYGYGGRYNPNNPTSANNLAQLAELYNSNPSALTQQQWQELQAAGVIPGTVPYSNASLVQPSTPTPSTGTTATAAPSTGTTFGAELESTYWGIPLWAWLAGGGLAVYLLTRPSGKR